MLISRLFCTISAMIVIANTIITTTTTRFQAYHRLSILFQACIVHIVEFQPRKRIIRWAPPTTTSPSNPPAHGTGLALAPAIALAPAPHRSKLPVNKARTVRGRLSPTRGARTHSTTVCLMPSAQAISISPVTSSPQVRPFFVTPQPAFSRRHPHNRFLFLNSSPSMDGRQIPPASMVRCFFPKS